MTIDIQSISKVHFKPGDVIVIHVNGAITFDLSEALKASMNEKFPGNECIVLSNGMSMSVISDGDKVPEPLSIADELADLSKSFHEVFPRVAVDEEAWRWGAPIVEPIKYPVFQSKVDQLLCVEIEKSLSLIRDLANRYKKLMIDLDSTRARGDELIAECREWIAHAGEIRKADADER